MKKLSLAIFFGCIFITSNASAWWLKDTTYTVYQQGDTTYIETPMNGYNYTFPLVDFDGVPSKELTAVALTAFAGNLNAEFWVNDYSKIDRIKLVP